MPKAINISTKVAIKKAFTHYKADRPDLKEADIINRLVDIFQVCDKILSYFNI